MFPRLFCPLANSCGGLLWVSKGTMSLWQGLGQRPNIHPQRSHCMSMGVAFGLLLCYNEIKRQNESIKYVEEEKICPVRKS